MSWWNTDLTRRWGVRLPIVQAPMAGGWTTPALVAAVSEAGALGSIAGAMLSPDALREQIRAVRSFTAQPFAVNLFAPQPAPSDRGVTEWAAVTGVSPPSLPVPRVEFADQLAVVVDERVPVLSFTFGIPPLDGVDCCTVGTATTVAESVAIAEAGVDAVVAQGFEAGGHRGTFLTSATSGNAPEAIGTMALVPQVVDAVTIPVLASGGIMDGRGIAAARALGAAAVQLGTAFLRTSEAATGAGYRSALDRPTTVTRVLTGRYARAVRTPLVDRLTESGAPPPDYPLPRSFLPEPPMLAGQGGPMARVMPAGELIRVLEAETTAAVRALSAE
ncbi:NAD(P)H-dependent flavin oxidoreductase [Nakamurella sp. GG22]